jgi:DNA-binding beta-propeller fold protein YncE
MLLTSDRASGSSLPRAVLGLGVIVALGAAPSCFSTDNGPEPPEHALYYPTSLVASPGGNALYVINSDFDLQYRAGTVQALDLGRIRTMMPKLGAGADPSKACADAKLSRQQPQDALLYPGACTAVDLDAPQLGGGRLVMSTAHIGAFATDSVLSLNPCKVQPVTAGAPKQGVCKGARLMIPVRGDPSLTWIDVDDDRVDPMTWRLDCGQTPGSPNCADNHRAGIDPNENTRSLTMPSEPFSVAISDDTTAAVVSHQTTGTASLVLNEWPTYDDTGAVTSIGSMKLSFVLGGLPTGVTGVLAFPKPLLATEANYPYQPGFLLSFRTSAEVDVLRYYDDKAASPSRPFIARTSRIGISTNATGFDSRGVAIDTRERRRAEAACPAGVGDERNSCLQAAAGVPVAAFAANRVPPSLLIGQTTTNASIYGTDDSVYFYDSVPLSQGPSRIYVAQVWDPIAGVARTRVFAVCFDARLIYVYDPDARAMEAVIQTGRGPTALAFDPLLGLDPTTHAALGSRMPGSADPPVSAAYAYLSHFTDSYIGVLDLDMSHSSYLSIIGSVGVPMPPRESK